MTPVYVPKTPHEKAMQRALLQFKNPANHELVCEALRLCGREDLIGFGPDALVAPRPIARYSRPKSHATEKPSPTRTSTPNNRSGKPTSRRPRSKHN